MNLLVDNKPIKEITKEYLEQIKKDLNCVGLLLIITDSQMPCPDLLAGKKCEHSHEVYSAIHNLSGPAVLQLAVTAIKNAL